MVGSSKILTVSYGTFSCTLEGFDDSFETMKAIAEYFRDLAADDRYFGAEPATPDADMLARIAEREIARRVQAHEDRGRIVLRAETAQALTEATPEAKASPTPEATPAKAEAAAPQPEPVTAPEAAQEAAVEPEGIEAETPEAQDETLEDFAEPEPEEEETAQDEEDAPEMDAPAEAREIEDDLEIEPESFALSEPEAEEAATPPVRSDSLAAKLSLIRSVVSETVPAEGEEFSEDEHAQDFLDAATEHPETADAADDGADWFQTTDEQEAEPKETERASDDAEETDAFSVHDEFEDTLAELMADAMIETESTPAQHERFVIAERIAIVETQDSDLYEDEDSGETEVFQDRSGSETQGRVIEMDTDLSPDMADVDADLRLEFDDLPEDEAELDTEREAVTEGQETASDDLDENLSEPHGLTADAPLPGREKLQKAEDAGDLMRFFDEADTQLEAPASSQRRNAIQHLRAAVAATRAERKAGSELQRNVDDAPYRSDLASVVRPRRPQVQVEGGRSLRPEEPRPAPLKLVAEQRIDMPRPPIQPRRISGAALRAEIEQVHTDSGFSTFAEELGLTRLPDLLEAAAAYLADVEGRPQFSRPMLMSKLREVEAEEFSREEGLRSFGQLLRTGKLQKLSGGRFSVTEQTEYRRQGKRQVG
jgi:hypothetical protein